MIRKRLIPYLASAALLSIWLSSAQAEEPALPPPPPPTLPQAEPFQAIEIEGSNPSYTAREYITYLDPSGEPPPMTFGHAGVAGVYGPYRDYPGQTRQILLSKEKFQEERQSISAKLLFKTRNTGTSSWVKAETFGPFEVHPAQRLDVDLVLSGSARILLEQYDSEEGPVGTNIVKNPDGRRKLIRHSMIAGTDTYAVSLVFLVPPGDTIAVENIVVSTVNVKGDEE